MQGVAGVESRPLITTPEEITSLYRRYFYIYIDIYIRADYPYLTQLVKSRISPPLAGGD